MELITKHCIDYFKEQFENEYPTVIEVEIDNELIDKIDKLIGKSELVWGHIIKIRGGSDKITQFLMYDKKGIMFYIIKNEKIFIMTTVDRLSVTEFTVHNLLKK
ncbi:MAG: hypothetical protein RLZ10_2305 [Bacteroidota bacterium]|jgi:hypothetical protein